MTAWKNYIGNRLLVTDLSAFDKESVIEVTVIEVSPRGRVKMLFPSGKESWEKSSEYKIVEVLA